MDIPSDNYLIDKANWPPALVKSIHDPFMYLLKLTTGEEWYVEHSAYLNDNYARIKLLPKYHNDNFGRGLEIRVSNIAWIADAPYGVNA